MIIQWLCLVVATEAVTELLVDAKIFDGFRVWLKKKGQIRPVDDPVHAASPVLMPCPVWVFLADLISCGYCTSVWVAAFFALFAPRVGLSVWVVDWLVTVFVLHRLSNWLHVGFSWFKNGRVRTYDVELKLTEPPVLES